MVALLCPTAAPAAEWAKKMFTVTSHNFGTVARGSKTEYRFVFKNIYEEDVHVVGVRTSCGCTSPVVTQRDLKTHETSEVVATFNTRTFLGQHGATLTVTFDKPYYAEVEQTATQPADAPATKQSAAASAAATPAAAPAVAESAVAAP